MTTNDEEEDEQSSSNLSPSSNWLDYLRYGPEAGGNSLLRRAAGLFVWWRIWVMSLLIMGSLGLLFQIEIEVSPSGGVSDAIDTALLIGWVVGVLISQVVDNVVWSGVEEH